MFQPTYRVSGIKSACRSGKYTYRDSGENDRGWWWVFGYR